MDIELDDNKPKLPKYKKLAFWKIMFAEDIKHAILNNSDNTQRMGFLGSGT